MRSERALVLGAGGQLGRALMACSPKNLSVTGLTRDECDITHRTVVQQCLDQLDPQLVINAAAYTAVDDAEDVPDRAFSINAHGPEYLATACAQRSIRLVHVSTDFVFDG